MNLPCELQSKSTNDQTLVSLRCLTPSNNGTIIILNLFRLLKFILARVKIYENCCQTLDITSDWQIRSLLPYDTIILSNRSFSFNDFRAFSTAIEINLKNLTLHSVGLTSRSIHVLCQGLKKSTRLNLLVKSKKKNIPIDYFIYSYLFI